MRKPYGTLCVSLCISLLLLFSVADVAQAAESGKDRLNSAFNAMLDDPADIQRTMNYAKIAIELKDYEAAIPPLERILFFNPDLAEIKLQLAIMYFHLKAYEVAEHYLLEVKQASKSTPELITGADEYIQMIKGKKE